MQWDHGEAQRECLPGSAAGRESMACVGGGLCKASLWDNRRETCDTFLLADLQHEGVFCGDVPGLNTHKPDVLSYGYPLMGQRVF